MMVIQTCCQILCHSQSTLLHWAEGSSALKHWKAFGSGCLKTKAVKEIPHAGTEDGEFELELKAWTSACLCLVTGQHAKGECSAA